MKAILDANRNSLMLLELRFSIWTLGLAAGTFIAALYGMNLKNFIEESDAGFWGVSIVCTVTSVIVLMYGLKMLRRVQRVSMWGNHCPPALPGASGWMGAREIAAEMRPDDRARKVAEKIRSKADALDAHSQGPLWTRTGAGGRYQQPTQQRAKTGSETAAPVVE